MARPFRLGRSVAALLALGGLLGLVAGLRAKRRALSDDLNRSRDLHGTGYVGSAACRRCHVDHTASWSRTFHRSMTAEATSVSVLGDFSGAILQSDGVTARMDRDGDGGYRMTFARAGEPPRVAKVVRTVGSRRYQQYLARQGDAYWRLPVAYHVEEKRWFPMTGAFLFSDPDAPSDRAPPGPVPPARPVFGGGDFDRHVTRWNDNCVFCHNVAPNPGRDPATGSFQTSVAELGVACEACHGPGAEHTSRNADPTRRYLLYAAPRADPTIVNPSRLSPARSADLCGRCHGQRIADEVEPFLEHGDPFVPGDDLAIESAPLWRDTPLHGDREAFAARFWRDGTARLTAYEYQGLLQSPCTMRGPLTCTSCHGMHGGDPRGQIRETFIDMGTANGSPTHLATGPVEQSPSGLQANAAANRMCTGCHVALGTSEALATHAHHDPAAAGGACVGCHMPRIVYGVLDVHRSHRIEIPDPARAASAGRPDACTTCHVDRSVAWAETAARGFWGADRYAATVAVADGTSPLEAILDGEPVARAVAADALGRAPLAHAADDRARRLGMLLDVMAQDRYPAVRHLAWRSLRRLAAPGAARGTGLAAAYDPSGTPADRARVVAHLHEALGPAAAEPAPAALAIRRHTTPDRDLEIGE